MTLLLFSATILVLLFLAWRVFLGNGRVTLNFKDGRKVSFIVRRGWAVQPNNFSALCLIDKKTGSTLQVSPFPNPIAKDDLRSAVEEMARHFQESSMEPQIVVQDIPPAADLVGYYFFAQDREVQPGGWAFTAGGAGLIGSAMITFTILSHYPYPDGMAGGFEILLNARMMR